MFLSNKKIFCTLFFIIIIAISVGHSGVEIKKIELPVAIHNGTGPVDLSCYYQINEDENGLIIKWYHDAEQIYQWIPPMPPEDIGLISGLTEYPKENLHNPLSHSIIRLKKVTVEMTGDYTCSVSTFSEDVAKTKHMTVYVPDHDLQIYTNIFNDTHVNLTCVARGARPRPSISIIVDNHELDENSIRIENYLNSPWIRQEAIVPEFSDLIIIQCEIDIPGTGYKRREKVVYHPRQYLHRNEAFDESYCIGFLSTLIISCLVIIF